MAGPNISRLENGGRQPREDTIRRIAAALGVSVVEFLAEELGVLERKIKARIRL
jgi:transcriptional regulator with XRE-family HTH domain